MSKLFAKVWLVVVTSCSLAALVASFRLGIPSPLVHRSPRRASSAPDTLSFNRIMKATKQITSISEFTQSLQTLEKFFLAGSDIFRINFSHGNHEEKLISIENVRKIEAKYKHPLGIIADIQGPKFRIGHIGSAANVKEHIMLEKNQIFTLDLDHTPGTAERVCFPHAAVIEALSIGDILLIDDGKISLVIIEKKQGPWKLVCQTMVGGRLSSMKGVNIPTMSLSVSSLTEKDKIDCEFIKANSFDWIAQSFVQSEQDIRDLRHIMNSKIKIMAKIEKPLAIENFEEIAKEADGIMIARGDLGVETNQWDIPVIQKHLIKDCIFLGKPVFIATQMFDSMINNPIPTRAETSDCATSVFDLADGVVLSAESSYGKYPVDAIDMQRRVIESVENDDLFLDVQDRLAEQIIEAGTSNATLTALILSARQVASISKSKAIIALSDDMDMSMHLSQLRPQVPIFALCGNMNVCRQLSAVWGVHPVFSDKKNISDILQVLCDKSWIHRNDTVTLVTSSPEEYQISANAIHVVNVADHC